MSIRVWLKYTTASMRILTCYVLISTEISNRWAQKKKIDAVGDKVEKGFERNFQMQVKQLEATVKISGQLANLTEMTRNGFGQVIENQIIQQNLSKATLNEVRNVNRGIADLGTVQK
jgi:hypothetical protein